MLSKHGHLTTTTLRHLSTSRPQTIFSGIQPTGIPHLGNYLGALQQWVHLQNTLPPSTTLLYSIVDLHALTTKQPPSLLRQHKRESLATLLAIGLNPTRSILFHQSSVPQHAELHWLLSCNASMGYLSRMTQWKTKLALSEANALDAITKQKLKLGLFAYPVLQAADVLVHGATHVPVGEDQAQHIEFARECAGNFNAVYGEEVLVRPETILGEARRVMSLTAPGKKMSKSDTDVRGRILLTDTKEEIGRKVRAALTDSVEGVGYDVENRPGVSNLVDVLGYVAGVQREDVLRDLGGKSLKALKEWVAREVDGCLEPIRERIAELLNGEKVLEEVAERGAERARESAERTMKVVREAVGLD